jgi:uncharacterized membrane protein
MKKLVLSLSIFTVLLVSTLFSCKHHPSVNPDVVIPKDTITIPTVIAKGDSTGWKCSPDSVYFQYDVLPVLVAACARSGCHDAISRVSGYVLTDYVNTMKKGISAGRASNSKVYTEIANGSMPPAGSGITMTQAQKDIVAKWINQGAKNLICNPNYGKCDTVGGAKFATFVQPIIQNRCQGCHNASSAGGGIQLTTHAQIKASVATGKFWGSINYLAGFSAMPKNSKMSACELAKIDSWIKRGALNN